MGDCEKTLGFEFLRALSGANSGRGGDAGSLSQAGLIAWDVDGLWALAKAPLDVLRTSFSRLTPTPN